MTAATLHAGNYEQFLEYSMSSKPMILSIVIL